MSISVARYLGLVGKLVTLGGAYAPPFMPTPAPQA